jgi:zinc transport system ATP-binding protein
MIELKAQDLGIGYDGKLLVEKLNFTVHSGDYLCILGENGSGKTTLMKTILGLKAPLCGSLEFGEGLKASEIGYLPQQADLQRDFPASVEEVVRSGCLGRMKLRPFYSRAEKALADERMKELGITALRRRCYRDLSGGQQQRVLLARALCATRKLLLMDEPVSGLDPLVTAEMYDLISRLNREGVTIIMVSHDIAAAVRFASHILHVGSEVFFGTVAEYRESELAKRFLPQEEGDPA